MNDPKIRSNHLNQGASSFEFSNNLPLSFLQRYFLVWPGLRRFLVPKKVEQNGAGFLTLHKRTSSC